MTRVRVDGGQRAVPPAIEEVGGVLTSPVPGRRGEAVDEEEPWRCGAR